MSNHILDLSGRGPYVTVCKLRARTAGDDLALCAHNEAGTEVTGLTLDPDAETLTPGVAFVLRTVDDDSMNATPGVKAEIVFNEADSKVYVCTAAHETAATWSPLN